MKILVTGGAGFIGSHVVEKLVADGHAVTIIDDFNDYYDPQIKHSNIALVRGDLKVVDGDIRDRDLVERLFDEGNFETVIHLAARAGVRPSIAAPELYLSTNINGTFNLIEAAKRIGTRRFLFASSSSVYGINKKVPFAEHDLIERTISPYAATKLAAEQICSNYSHLYRMEVACLRFFTVYGPRQRPDLAISLFTRKIDQGEPINRFGNGSTARDYTYVEDIVQGVVGALHLEDLSFDLFNLGGSQTITLSELISEVEKAVGKTALINEMPEQPGDVPRTFADIDKSRRLLGYDPQTPIREGIPKYVEWYRATLNLSTSC